VLREKFFYCAARAGARLAADIGFLGKLYPGWRNKLGIKAA